MDLLEAIILRVNILLSYAIQNKKDLTSMSPDFYINELKQIIKKLEDLQKDYEKLKK